MSSSVPISSNELSQYQLETALDNFTNIKNKVANAVFDFLLLAKSNREQLTVDTLVRFLETYIENSAVNFKNVFLTTEFINKINTSIAAISDTESTASLKSNKLTDSFKLNANDITKEILASIHENTSDKVITNNHNLKTTSTKFNLENSTTDNVSSVDNTNLSSNIPNNHLRNTQFNIINFQRNGLRRESAVLLGALAITFDKLNKVSIKSNALVPITAVAASSPQVISTIATGGRRSISKIAPVPFKIGRKPSLNIFSKFKIFKIFSPIGKFFKISISASLKVLKGTVKIIAKTATLAFKGIIKLTSMIVKLGKAVFSTIGKGLTSIFKLIKKATIFSVKRIGSIFKAVFLTSKIGVVFLPYLLGFIYGYVKTKFFSSGSFLNELKSMLDSIIPKLPDIGNQKKDGSEPSDEIDDGFLNRIGNLAKATALKLYNKLNTPLTKDEVEKVTKLVKETQDAVDEYSPVPVPVQIFCSILDGLFEKLGIDLKLQENAIHYTNVFGVLVKGKDKYDKLLAANKNKRDNTYTNLLDSINKFGEENVGKGKLDILYTQGITPLIDLVNTMISRFTGNFTDFIKNLQEKFTSLQEAIKEFSFDDLDKYKETLDKLTNELVENIEDTITHISGLIGAKAAGSVAGIALGVIGWFTPVGHLAKIVTSILVPFAGMLFGKFLGKTLLESVTCISEEKEIDHLKSDVESDSKHYERFMLPDLNAAKTKTPVNPVKTPKNKDDSAAKGSEIQKEKKSPDISTDVNPKSPASPSIIKKAIEPVSQSVTPNNIKPVPINPLQNNTVERILKDIKTLAQEDIKNRESNDTVLTPLNIATILSQDVYDLQKLTSFKNDLSPVTKNNEWVNLPAFKYLRAIMLLKFLDKYFTNPAIFEKEKSTVVFGIKRLFMMLSDPNSIYYHTFDESIGNLANTYVSNQIKPVSGLTMTLAERVNLLVDSPVKRQFNSNYYNSNKIPLAYFFTKINDNKFEEYENNNKYASEQEKALTKLKYWRNTDVHNNLLTSVDTDTGTTLASNLFSDKFINENSTISSIDIFADRRRFEKRVNEYFPTKAEVEEFMKLKMDAEREIKRTEELSARELPNNETASKNINIVAFPPSPMLASTNNPTVTINFGDNSSNRRQDFVDGAVITAYT